ncbi:type IV toxin-antitoxin system AbiEi family antitoxin domain-containing protein [Rhodococcoides corynebacterioides]|uniref:Transcriptional regulator, AbiEi antitoxin, Type IV TA system n=1 Tax=Rhodococcoides corynebacterioides TaxID=53972 RepID=A0ABS7NZ32_9NOCA|nr:type IV toxin-antitoxin system AbiEi family antitoxin domain-containing protein [Rhodococcus corynebacterioides]MBY6365382.1 hypothetical protein [Rhodococcus corynebacterioides]MBY6407964.1 hypothetical protein [Rhodococcus corynebacterioides]
MTGRSRRAHVDFRGEHLMRRAHAAAQGLSDHDIAELVKSGDMVCVHRGIYAPGDHYRHLDSDRRHLLTLRAHLMCCTSDVFAGHQSAALLHGMQLLRRPSLVHLATTRAAGGHVTATRHVHAEGLDPVDVCVVDGCATTTAARTVADLARVLPFEDAVCVGDSALRRGLTVIDDVIEALDRTGTSSGRVAARAALRFLSPASESVGESRSRVYFRHFGIPQPELQVTLVLDDGTEVRPDFLWDDAGVLGEFDGKSKYGRLARPDESPADVVHREKLREDRLRAQGWRVVRWGTPDLRDGRLARRLTGLLFDVPAGRPTTRRR